MQRLARTVAGAACLLVLTGCGGGSPEQTTTPAPGPSIAEANAGPADGARLVRYELSGTAVTIDGTYSEPAAGAEKMVQLREIALPWSKNFTLPPNQLFVAGVVAQGPNLESTITCKIIKDGAVIAEQTGATVDCRAEVS